jgi:hypothetical protein
MTEQEARDAIIAWAKEHFTPISTVPEEFDLTPEVSVAGIHYDAEFDVWDAKLSVSSLLEETYATFTENASYPHGIEVSNIEF